MNVKPLIFVMLFLVVLPGHILAQNKTKNAYVGSAKCKSCHETEYENFIKHSKHAKAWQGVAKMEAKLSPEELRECYSCHTTGYAQPSGFISLQKTPYLAEVGCEACHGPGKAHIESDGDPSYIKTNMSEKTCLRCHNKERINTFNFYPLIYAGSH